MAESEELKSLLMKVKEESEKVGLNLSIQKAKFMASGPITSWQIDGETVETVTDFIFLGFKITADGDCIHEISTVCCDPQFKGFSVVNETEVDVFLEFSCFFDDPTDVGNLMSGSSAFSNSSLSIWKFSVRVLLKPNLENFEHSLLACEMNAIVR